MTRFLSTRGRGAVALAPLVLVLAACGGGGGDGGGSGGSSPTVSPSRPGTGTSTPGGSTGGDPAPTPAGDTNCSIGDITEQHTCEGPNRPGVESMGVFVRGTTIPTFTGKPETATMYGYLTAVVNDVARYWTAAYAKAGFEDGTGRPAVSTVRYQWIAAGQRYDTKCTSAATERSMFYCPGDDTIYLGIPAILADWQGILQPGETSHPATGEGSAIYTVAHEYGHNIEQEVGINPKSTTLNSELLADCLAGAYLRGGILLDSRSNRASFLDVIANADFSGDYKFERADFHGTPDDRMIAVLEGHNTASPKVCEARYEP